MWVKTISRKQMYKEIQIWQHASYEHKVNEGLEVSSRQHSLIYTMSCYFNLIPTQLPFGTGFHWIEFEINFVSIHQPKFWWLTNENFVWPFFYVFDKLLVYKNLLHNNLWVTLFYVTMECFLDIVKYSA